jgi:hypothetical protein
MKRETTKKLIIHMSAFGLMFAHIDEGVDIVGITIDPIL